MAFFQNSVLQKHLKSQNKAKIAAGFEVFKNLFQHAERQQNIRNSKEEQYQGEFLIELFVDVLGYVKSPNANFNLITEQKNASDSKKADGAILKDEKILAVIELKGTDTKDLEKVAEQAFNYKASHRECVYVVTSNFEKLRFYINHKVDYLEFNLFTLNLADFEVLWLCLHADNLLNNVALTLKTESTVAEENVTKTLYKDYATFKNDLWQNLVKNHPDQNQLTLFKKTQKLIDRFLFLFFAEDGGLLPPNSITRIIDRYQLLKDEDAYKPLYEIFKQYFGYINTGRKGKTPQDDIFAYNGGLFLHDDILEHAQIDDDVLLPHVKKLTIYDFESEVDVNILGHIFENSLNEIEQITAQLEGVEVDNSKTKRKKDGVFYTPKYITKYIVENTVGKLCEAKKTELSIVDKEYAKGRKNRKTETLKKLDTNLQTYRQWLLKLTIVDPACGSGAFLNQALDFLIKEHHYVDALESQLLGNAFEFPGVENHILEKNIFGVDINDESVEIAKLSLWLRTAQRGRKLTTLNNNIKCGNSLVNDAAVAGDKAFDWHKEFPQVFQEKNKTAWHITTATHDSRTSQRMIDHKVRLKRDGGTHPNAEPIRLEIADEILIAEKVAEIVAKDKLNILAFNICKDHMHLLLVCEEEEVSKIVGKIKSITGRAYNINKGITVPGAAAAATTRGHDPLAQQQNSATAAPRGHDPLPGHSLWTQKFSTTYINSDEQLHNTINYIQNNRTKHSLPNNLTLQKITLSMCCGLDQAFGKEYKDGFDVVLGNPPYVRQELITPFKPYLAQNFSSFAGTADLYTYFIEMGVDTLIQKNGIYSIIVSNKWMRARFGQALRDWMINKHIVEIVDFGDLPVFADATAYPCILTLKKESAQETFTACLPTDLTFGDLQLYVNQHGFTVNKNQLSSDGWALVNNQVSSLIEKLKQKGQPLGEFVNGNIFYGIKTGFNEAFVIDRPTRDRLIAEDAKSKEVIKPFLAGRDVKRYYLDFQEKYLILFPSGFTNQNRGEMLAEDFMEKNYKPLFSYLKSYEEQCKKRYDKGNYWWELRACDYYQEFEKPKIEVATISIKPAFSLSYTGHYSNDKTTIIGTDNKTLLAVLNSPVSYFFIKSIASTKSGGFFEYKPMYIGQIPIPPLKNEAEISAKVSELEIALAERNGVENGFLKLLTSKFNLDKLSQKLESWPSLDFKSFLAELAKAKVKLSLPEEAEWLHYFTAQKEKAIALQNQITQLDKEIDQHVYKLYGLSEEEIKVVEETPLKNIL